MPRVPETGRAPEALAMIALYHVTPDGDVEETIYL
jgi:hypothetical protein